MPHYLAGFFPLGQGLVPQSQLTAKHLGGCGHNAAYLLTSHDQAAYHSETAPQGFYLHGTCGFYSKF